MAKSKSPGRRGRSKSPGRKSKSPARRSSKSPARQRAPSSSPYKIEDDVDSAPTDPASLADAAGMQVGDLHNMAPADLTSLLNEHACASAAKKAIRQWHKVEIVTAVVVGDGGEGASQTVLVVIAVLIAVAVVMMGASDGTVMPADVQEVTEAADLPNVSAAGN